MFALIWFTSGFAALYIAHELIKNTKKGLVCSEFLDLAMLIACSACIVVFGTISLAGALIAYINIYFNKRFSSKKPFVVVKGNDARV